MSASFSIHSSTGSYEVRVAAGSLTQTVEERADAYLLVDAFFQSSLGQASRTALFLAAEEREKSLDRMPYLIEQMRATGVHRRTLLTAIGGGILQDIAAFTASVYMRGLRWMYVPTTVLAMVDSCIGGKSSINVGPYKNLVGTFHPPEQIWIDPAVAETLPRDQFASGLIEAAKICFCRGEEAFQAHMAAGPSTTMSTAALEAVIINSLQAKKYFIEIDEFDKKERLLLNFGHTFGHAIEGASHYAIPHGIAVGVGILCSLAFQRERGLAFEGIERIAIFERHMHEMVTSLPGIGEHLAALSIDGVMERFASDKKHTGTHFTLILVDGAGSVILEQIEKSEQTSRAVRQAIETTRESYTR